MSKKFFGVAIIAVALGLGACTKGPSNEQITQAEISHALFQAEVEANTFGLGNKFNKAAARKNLESLLLEKDTRCVELQKNKYKCIYKLSLDKGLTFKKKERTLVMKSDGSYSIVD